MRSHDQEYINLVKNLYQAASRGDFTHIRAALDPRVEWIEPNVSALWFSGTHRGADAVWKEVITPTGDKFERFRLDMKEFYVVGDQVIAIGYFHGRAKATGKELDAATAQVCTIRNGKIARFEAYHDTDNWLETLGLAGAESQRMAA
jgi:ketosteroid isomerase-like protein